VNLKSDSATPDDLLGVPEPSLIALTLVMEGRVTLADAVRVLMAREGLERAEATELVLDAATFASSEYSGRPLRRSMAQAD
jgi:hypothetical protein